MQKSTVESRSKHQNALDNSRIHIIKQWKGYKNVFMDEVHIFSLKNDNSNVIREWTRILIQVKAGSA